MRFPTARRSRVLLVGVLLAGALVVFDLQRPPPSQWSGRLMIAGIQLYQATLSRLWPHMGLHCRFAPTCSHYAAATIRQHGALVGTSRALGRLVRCGPWTPRGTVDPP